jgi:hypothetical protein
LRTANALAAAKDPSFVLSRESLEVLKNTQFTVYAKIAPVYSNFLREKAGLK